MQSIKRSRRQFNPDRLTTLAYLDAEAVNRYAPIAKRTYYQLIADGKLPAFRIGGTGKLVVKKADLDRLLTTAPVESKTDQVVEEVMSKFRASK